MKITTRELPILGKDGEYSIWVRIPNIPGSHSSDTIRLLSISKHSTIEIKPDDEGASLLVFPIGRYITITPTIDNKNQKVWVTYYNPKDLKKDSEHPETNPNENLR